jgi:hypothetical protein
VDEISVFQNYKLSLHGSLTQHSAATEKELITKSPIEFQNKRMSSKNTLSLHSSGQTKKADLLAPKRQKKLVYNP